MASYPAWNGWNGCPPGWPQRAWCWVKLFGGVYLALCIFVLVVTYNTLWAARPEIAVPPVVGQQQTDAVRLLQQNGLVVKVLDGVPSDSFRPGEIVHQSLSPGTHVREGRTIFLVDCPGPATTLVPNLVPSDSTAALKKLTDANLDGEVAASVDSLTVPFDGVIRQYPGPGVRVPAGSSVMLIVSDGPPDSSADPGAQGGSPADGPTAKDVLIPVTPGDWNPPQAGAPPTPAGAASGPGAPSGVPGGQAFAAPPDVTSYPGQGGDDRIGASLPPPDVSAGAPAPGSGPDETVDPSDPAGLDPIPPPVKAKKPPGKHRTEHRAITAPPPDSSDPAVADLPSTPP